MVKSAIDNQHMLKEMSQTNHEVEWPKPSETRVLLIKEMSYKIRIQHILFTVQTTLQSDDFLMII